MSKVIIRDVISFLNDDRLDLRRSACSTVSKLTGTADGLQLILQQEELVYAIICLLKDQDSFVLKTCLKILVNISVQKEGATKLLDMDGESIITILLDHIKCRDFAYADITCGVLANLTRSCELCSRVVAAVAKSKLTLDELVSIVCHIGYNTKGASLDLLSTVIANFTQTGEGRRDILNKDKCIFVRLLPFTVYPKSIIRRKAIVSAIHNCCFNKDCHPWLLGEDVDVASHLCLPLAGPDTLTEEENNSLPLDLQFLPHDKHREEDPHIKALLLQALFQLCTTRQGRERLRSLNIYLILREYHLREEDAKCQSICDDVVNLLLKTEEEIGYDDLSQLAVPQHLVDKFNKFDVDATPQLSCTGEKE